MNGMRIEPSKVPEHWTAVGKTGAVTRRFEFENYAATSVFLDRLATISEETGLFPDLGFATRYVNVTIPADPETGDTSLRNSFAERVNDMFEGQMT
ncbi:4a-hydroxytetrahydrobiopterin dehydratase [Roseivivax sediminis]|uniref:4a-hydroxytetrahydrobiopterin dehydratase n=1 Tax=Roseivivax sediminis TaxID=936889 RepID=A0A1I1XW20_9RHOB|nr:4a-hydroxytetrahydrobiopterin dehydratase [Roseivivax sediminis]SFE11492.1 Pterin-4a-carbinolamine dehydratase [Roseivivax sediminis]